MPCPDVAVDLLSGNPRAHFLGSASPLPPPPYSPKNVILRTSSALLKIGDGLTCSSRKVAVGTVIRLHKTVVVLADSSSPNRY